MIIDSGTALNSISKALNAINTKNIKEMKSSAKVHPGLELTLKAVIILLQTERYTDWVGICARTMKDPSSFIEQLRNLDLGQISENTHKQIKPILANPDFKGFSLEASKSVAAASLYTWVIAVNDYYMTYKRIRLCR